MLKEKDIQKVLFHAMQEVQITLKRKSDGIFDKFFYTTRYKAVC